ncbi:hypothetical protein ACFS3C_22585 [Azotobacter vinelandii]
MNLRKQPLPHRSRPATLAAAVRGALLYLPLASVILSMPLTAIAEQTTNQEFSIAPPATWMLLCPSSPARLA